jgi:hypothetical protein
LVKLNQSFREVTSSTGTFDARTFISNLLEDLVLFDPVTGEKVVTEVTVQQAYRRYVFEAGANLDIHAVSATSFRTAWDLIVANGKYVIKSPRRVHKCEICLELNSATRKVC